MSNAKLTKLIERQELTLKELEKDFSDFKKETEARKSRGYVNACIADSEECFKRAKKDHEGILNSSPDPIREAYFEAEVFANIKRIYFSFTGMLTDLRDKFAETNNTNLELSRLNTTKTSVCDIRSPPIQIKKFSGLLEEWNEFHNLFESMVDQNIDLSDTQKLQFLKTHVTDSAALLIQHLVVDADGKNYAAAWEILNERYQNKRKLVNKQLRILMEQNKIIHESADALKSLHDTSITCYHALSNLGIAIETWDTILIYVLYHKLPPQTQRDWEEKLGSSKSLPEWTVFIKFIEGRFSSLENMMESNEVLRPINASNTLKKVTQTTYHNKSYDSKNFLCRLCNAAHGIRQCKQFLKMEVRARVDVVKRNSICANCLGYDHHASNCRSSNRCQRCGHNHHTLLHAENQNANYRNEQKYFPNASAPRGQNRTEYNAHFIQNGNEYAFSDAWNNQQDGDRTVDYPTHSNSVQHPNQFRTSNQWSDGQTDASTSFNYVNAPNQHQNPNTRILHNSQNSEQYQTMPLTNNINSYLNQMRSKVLLATALVKVVAANGVQHVIRALIDPGSEATFITENVAQILGLKRQKTLADVKGLGQISTGTSNSMVNLTIFSFHNPSFCLDVKALVFSHLTSMLPAQKIFTSSWGHLANLPLADPSYFKPAKIDMLLGADVYGEIICQGLIPAQNGSPVAQNTELGWILTGGTNDNLPPTSLTVQSHHTTLEAQLKKFWEIEEDLELRKLTPEEIKCEKHYEENTRRTKDGRYEVRLPFKGDTRPNLGNSKGAAMARFFQIERRLNSNIKLKEAYTACIGEYITLGHMKEVTIETDLENGEHYYLPHHAVFKESSSTTKLRVVFDASCKTSRGASLNDHLMIGPRLQADIIELIAQWRKFKVAFAADISMMYRQIWMALEDTPYQLILWRGKANEKIKTYALNTVTFGTASAPYLAVRTLHQVAKDIENSKPHVSKAITKGFYVDDFIYGADNEEEAIKIQTDVLSTLKAAGFPLRKWASNSTSILERIPENEREVNLPLKFDSTDAIKMLGIQWHPAKDTFTFKINVPDVKNHTKRSVLADIARLFDPLGWISPCIIKAKLILQQLWVKALSWNSGLSPEIEAQWTVLRDELQKLEMLEIPRWIGSERTSQIQLHGFCDSSEKAYAAVIYARVLSNGKERIHLLTAKTRVAPIKKISLPRLELCAALLLARLLYRMSAAMQFEQLEMFAWSDSMIALAWIKGSPALRNTFVANRVTEIQALTNENIWRHVGTKDNPADVGSRGLSPEELIKSNLWWHGPNFLIGFSAHDQPIVPQLETNEETKKEAQLCLCTTTTTTIKYLETCSNLQRLVRNTAILRRYFDFIKNTQAGNPVNTQPITAEELISAHQSLIKFAQREIYNEEIIALKNKRPISKKSTISNLNPFLDEDGILRVGGRLSNAPLSFQQRHPIILKEAHHLTKLIVTDIHLQTFHGGQQMMMAEIRNRYWITNLKRTVKAIIHKCVRCHRYNAKMQEQIMGSLPSARVSVSRPFYNTGVDYAGPIEIKMWKGRCNRMAKGYIAVFICLATKAIHIELVSDLSTAAFIAAFRRFVARRGSCANLFSDCGTNFKGASNELRKDSKFITSEWSTHVAKTLASQQTTWHFNPPSSPHFGGLWEAGVKSIKYHLRRTIGSAKLTFEEYATLLTQIEACLNSRPLQPMTSDPEDLNVLTPGHFLIGEPLRTVPDRNLIEKNINNLDRWRYLQRLTQDFWKQWSTSYLHLLQQRPKWLQEQPSIKLGDIVLVKEDNLPPSGWLLARVIELHPGADGLTRVVTIKTKDSIFKRPIAKISPLPIKT